ncbi:CRACD-like protein isoform X2 [Megalobrama amblycephala]|uniref:CRACD-like protein isoform X2 n=1 Tax=Megalobrama amblycephala TaxID=75352 RepID=UPI00201453E9|nr:CRACD-like protein isoform X2 [Megalobrama amblycephala]
MSRLYSCFGDKNDCDIMASGSPDVTATTEPSEAAEECSGKKKSKFQTFKNFFVKKKRKESPAPSGESGLKASQSSDDVNTSEPTISHANSDNDRGSKISLGNKAMSHDSVFVSDSPSSETNEGLGASQDNIHGKVKSLQLQLKHAICLGSPPSLLCGRKGEDAGALSEDDGLPCSPTEYSSLHTVLATPLHASVDLTQSSLSMEGSDSEDDQMSYEASSRPATPQGSVPVDFSLPASSVSCLDSSAARHRIAVKTNACAKRKPASRQMLDKRRDLRERVLLRETEDKLRMVTSIGEEEHEDLPGEQVYDSDHESCASGHEDEEVTDSGQCHKTSPTSSISAGDVSEGDEHVTGQDHVPKSELPESSWESPVTLELQADDFLLDTGCEVVPEEQGSLLEEVLSSLKSPLASGLALEHENMVLQSEVKDLNSESVVDQLEEEDNNDLLDLSNPIVTTEEQAPLPDSLSESSVDSEEISEETTEEEELLELPEFAGEETTDGSRQVPDADVEKQVDKAESAKDDKELFELPKAFTVNVKERDEDVIEEVAEIERETKDGGDDVEKDDELTVLEAEKTENSTNVELQEAGGHAGSLEPENEASGDERESVEINVESIPESDQTVRDDVWSSTETADASEPPPETPVEVLLSPGLESPVLHCQFFNASMSPLEQEEEAEPTEPDVSSEPQEVSSEKLEVVSEQQDQPVVESPTRESTSNAEVRPRFTIAPAWQRSLASGGTQEQSQTISLLLPEAVETNASSPQTTELFTPVKEERPKPAQVQSSPTLPMQKETIHVQEEMTPENPFGVRLRKTPVLHRYGLDGESPWTQTQTESSGAQETPDRDQNDRKPVLPKKPDLLVDTVMSSRKIPDTVGRTSVGSSESPSWISVARQKQKNFIEQSPESSPEKLPSQGDVKREDPLPSLSNPVTKEQLAQPCSPLQVFCSLELSNTSMLEKESKKSTNPSAAPLAQDEPPWLALAKKKAKAWSEMPQIVQ